MDISENYIKMCKKAIQIQDLWEYKQGDWFVDKDFYKYGVNVLENDIRDDSSGDYFYSKTELIKSLKDNDSIWLPRQDQLQEMIKGEKHMHLLFTEIAAYFHGSIDPFMQVGRDNYTVDSDNSAEQMWLGFVMAKKYQKQWDGEDWISVK